MLRFASTTPYRATLDLDLLWRGAGNREAIAEDIRLVCATPAPDAAVEFDASDLTVDDIRAEDEYAGLRGRFDGLLGQTRTRLQIDIGVADATPEGLTDAYWEHQGRDAQLRAFVRRARVRVDMQAARSLLPLLRQVSLAALGCGAQRATL